MLKLCRVTKVKVRFLVLVYVFNFNLFKFSAAILAPDRSQHSNLDCVDFFPQGMVLVVNPSGEESSKMSFIGI